MTINHSIHQQDSSFTKIIQIKEKYFGKICEKILAEQESFLPKNWHFKQNTSKEGIYTLTITQPNQKKTIQLSSILQLQQALYENRGDLSEECNGGMKIQYFFEKLLSKNGDSDIQKLIEAYMFDRKKLVTEKLVDSRIAPVKKTVYSGIVSEDAEKSDDREQVMNLDDFLDTVEDMGTRKKIIQFANQVTPAQKFLDLIHTTNSQKIFFLIEPPYSKKFASLIEKIGKIEDLSEIINNTPSKAFTYFIENTDIKKLSDFIKEVYINKFTSLIIDLKNTHLQGFVNLLEKNYSEQLVDIINKTSTKKLAYLIENTDSEKLAYLINNIDSEKLVYLIENTDFNKIPYLIKGTPAFELAYLIQNTNIKKLLYLIQGTSYGKCTYLINNIDIQKLSDFIKDVDIQKLIFLTEHTTLGNFTYIIQSVSPRSKIVSYMIEVPSSELIKIINENNPGKLVDRINLGKRKLGGWFSKY